MNYAECKKLVLKKYSRGRTPKCKKCGSKENLQIDHLNNNGKAERAKYGSGSNFYRYLIRNNYPRGFQVLCGKCNVIKGIVYHEACIKSLTQFLHVKNKTRVKKKKQ